ncbi:MAG TPA: tetratricopeptide repeat protein [Terriglobia bacterium]|nr:tetratricopeptide repeat protein [Terriglobia bacterium]
MKKVLLTLVILLLAWSSLDAAPETRTLLVFPFENQSSNSDLGWISEAFAQVLSWRLAGPSRYVLGREERNAAYEQLGLPLDTPLTLASSYKVAQTLGVDWAVVGSFKIAGNQLTARCELLDVQRLKLTPALEATGALADLVDIQTQLVWRLLATNDPDFTAGTEEDFARGFPPIRLDAFENYIRGILATDNESRVHFLREADRLNPADHRAAFALGQEYFDQKQYAESGEWLRELAPADANYLESLFFLGVDEYFLGEDTKAEQSFAKLESQIPLDEVANNLGLMKARRGKYAEALADLERAYQGDPTDPDFCFNMAVCLWRLKRDDEAAQYLEKGLREKDDDPEAHALLARVDEKLGNRDGQQRELQWLANAEGASAADPPPDFTPQMRLKKFYNGRAFHLLALVVRNTEEAKLAAEPPAEHAQAHLTQGKKLMAQGRLAEAERDLNEAESLAPESSEVHLVLGQVYEAEGRHREAAAELEASLRYDNNAMTHLWLARVYVSLNQRAQALDQGRAALALDPGNPDAERLVEAIRQRPAARKTP